MKYYPVSLNLSGRSCVVVGGGEVAERKIRRLLDSDADVLVVSEKLTSGLEELRDKGKISHAAVMYQPTYLQGAFLVFGTTDDAEVNGRIFKDARKRGIPVNIADDPEHCDFILPSLAAQGDLQIAVSTAGKSPALARLIRKEIESLYGPEYAVYLMILGDLRKKVLSGGHPAQENKKIFEDIIHSDILDKIRSGDRSAVRQLVSAIAGVDLDLERYMP